MTQTVANQEPIILIGPMKAGKTTVGTRLTARLDCLFISLDRLERRYTEASASIGFSPTPFRLRNGAHL